MKKLEHIIYLRVSTSEQDTANQLHGIKKYMELRNTTPTRTVSDTASGKVSWRKRSIGELIENGTEGTVIYVAEISRLARENLQILEIAKEAISKRISIVVVKEGFILDGSEQSKMFTTFLGMFAEMERDKISSRTKEALERRKAEGQKLGRPAGSKSASKLDKRRAEIERYLAADVPIRAICRIVDCAPATFYSWATDNNLRETKAN